MATRREVAGWVSAFRTEEAVWRDLGLRCEALIEDLLRAGGLRVQDVAHRVKSSASLEQKLASPDASYDGVRAVTDLLGIRIITDFPDEVDHAGRLIEAEFDIDEPNSIDRRQLLEPDRFGYLSLHYIASVSPSRLAHSEWARFGGMRFEVQVRSILQHAWAEIEHDLGYKTDAAIPDPARRRFSRLAGLLEIADQEFATIRDDLAAYQSSLESDVREDPTSVGIDQESLREIAVRSPLVRGLDKDIARLTSKPRLRPPTPGYLAAHAVSFRALGLRNVGEVQWALEQYRDEVLGLARRWLADLSPDHPSFLRGISLYYLTLTLIANPGSVSGATDLLQRAGHSDESAKQMAERLVADLDVVRREVAFDRGEDFG